MHTITELGVRVASVKALALAGALAGVTEDINKPLVKLQQSSLETPWVKAAAHDAWQQQIDEYTAKLSRISQAVRVIVLLYPYVDGKSLQAYWNALGNRSQTGSLWKGLTLLRPLLPQLIIKQTFQKCDAAPLPPLAREPCASA